MLTRVLRFKGTLYVPIEEIPVYSRQKTVLRTTERDRIDLERREPRFNALGGAQ